MKKRTRMPAWARAFERSLSSMTRMSTKSGARALGTALKPEVARHTPPPGAGAWIAGVALGASGARRFRLYRPPDVKFGERLPLMVMLHGCGQDGKRFATSTRMNAIANRERFLVLYPEQDRVANAQGCWNWFDTRSGRAWGEAELIMRAIDQKTALSPVWRDRCNQLFCELRGYLAGASVAPMSPAT